MGMDMDKLNQNDNLQTTVSIIIPVYNDRERLSLCLEALACQTYPQDLWEIIVVDNGSDDASQVEQLTKQYKNVIFTQEEQVGSYAARNQGISIAKGEAIGFTDADCIPHKDWIEKGVSRLRSTPECGLVAGKVELFNTNPDRQNSIEIYEKVMAFRQQEFLEQNHYGVTANVFTWKKVIEKVGGFSQNLKSSGDAEWGKRVYQYGYKQVYASEVCIDHPARNSWGELYRQKIRHTGGVYDLYFTKQETKWQSWQLLIRYMITNALPPVNFAIKIFQNQKTLSVTDKIKVVIIFALARFIILTEIFRLLLGRKSARE